MDPVEAFSRSRSSYLYEASLEVHDITSKLRDEEIGVRERPAAQNKIIELMPGMPTDTVNCCTHY